MNISKNISSIREAKGIKQYQVAEILGIEPPNYSRLEKRGDKLTIEQLEKISVALGVSVKELLFGEKEESKEDTQVLKSRIAELESIVKDKSKIIRSLEDDIEATKNTLADYWYFFIMEIADKYDFKVFEYESEKGTEKLTIKEYLQLPYDVRQKVFLDNDEIDFSKEEDKKLYLELVQSEKYVRAIMVMDACGFGHKELSEAINRYGKRDFMKVANSIGDFTK